MQISSIKDKLLSEKNIKLDLLRLDLLHPQISGNKWFKLKYNFAQAEKENKKTVLSFGGAYSNHLHALAYAGKESGLKTVGIIRGEEVMNDTLTDCKSWGMHLHFISRSEYRNKTEEDFLRSIQEKFPDCYVIPEGGNNEPGIKGCSEILKGIDLTHYDIIVCPVGTGATLTGLIESSAAHNYLLGIAAIKNGAYLNEEVKKQTTRQNWDINHAYHFGGFAKKNQMLLDFMQHFTTNHAIELDFVYTAKMMYALYDLIQKNAIQAKHILALHTGGLQGNRSLF